MAAQGYHRLAQDESEEAAQAPGTETTAASEDTASAPLFVPDVPPPEYSEAGAAGGAAAEAGAKLPTYEEYEKEHEGEDEYDTNLPEDYTLTDTLGPRGRTIAVVQGLDLALGDDFTFCGAFFLSFFLNWVGFLLAYCFSRTIAGKCGATSGFGLGLIKLAFLLRNNEHMPDTSPPDARYAAWFVWVMVLFGWFTFVRGITLYLRYKREFAVLQRELSAV
eukprot:comp9480_c0_seq1/m.4523 comp9480_c0_seq1/g.4523  ORF comp9480_c0_seq1/g.4523 comp9480_c0_seq1/m.4523 type:complete len:220 (-) comp9480_c0_seq1:96-755(-)